MKLVFTEPHRCQNGTFPSFFMNSAIAGYLQYRNIFVDDKYRDLHITYNDFHHFYNIKLYENENFKLKQIDEVIELFKSEADVYNIQTTWESERKGKQFCVRAILPDHKIDT